MFRALALAILLSLQGCFFVYLPGNVVGGISDAITGAEGNACVSTSANVGTLIKMPDGRSGTITKLSGTSIRCEEPERPIRAVLAFQ